MTLQRLRGDGMTKRKAKELCYREIRRIVSFNGIREGLEIHHVFGRTGLNMVNPHTMIALTVDEHIRAHYNMKAFAKEIGYEEQSNHDKHISVKDYQRLAAMWGKARTVRDLKNLFDEWRESL